MMIAATRVACLAAGSISVRHQLTITIDGMADNGTTRLTAPTTTTALATVGSANHHACN